MKINTPITGHELDYGDAEIISTTNLKGILKTANDDFVRISGFEWSEIENKSHNVIRHPDMPPEAFHMLWDSLKAGKAWMGLVKNRCKNGDHYWVDAFVSPQYEDGKIVGYQSIRVRPKRSRVDRAAALYKKIMAKKTPDDLRRSAISKVKLTHFKISFVSKVSLAFMAIIVLLCGGLTLAGQLPWMWALGGAAVGCVATYLICGLMFKSFKDLAKRCKSVVDDPLAEYIYTGRTDELAHIDFALEFINAKLRTAIGRVRESSDVLERASQEISAGSVDLSERTEQQAVSLEETASTMEEMTSAVQQNADNAQEANRLIQETHRAAVEGASIVRRAVHAMEEINVSSQKISDIISVIDGISFQTNLLALNAAVEAARAAEQGRGFAVVANEVRNLAGRSAESAKEISALINESVAKAAQGTELVNKSGDALEDISHRIEKATGIIAEIATASVEQARGIEQINVAITQMDDTTQRNAALVEESAAASAAMTEKVKMLAGLAIQFKQDNAL